jgi:hypothetical protein
MSGILRAPEKLSAAVCAFGMQAESIIRAYLHKSTKAKSTGSGKNFSRFVSARKNRWLRTELKTEKKGARELNFDLKFCCRS